MTFISYICHYNDEDKLRSCLVESLKSNMKRKDELFLLKDYKSQASAYAYAEKEVKNDLMVFVHQDTYLPKGWRKNFLKQVKRLEKMDKEWGVIGVIGINVLPNYSGIRFSGHFADEFGEFKTYNLPTIGDSIDSFVFSKRKNGICFDENIPTFHGAVEDICYQIKAKGKNVWIIDCLTEHRTHHCFGVDDKTVVEMVPARDYLIKKWGLPVICGNILWGDMDTKPLPVSPLTRSMIEKPCGFVYNK